MKKIHLKIFLFSPH